MSLSPCQYLLPDNWNIKKSIDFLTTGLSTEVEPEYQLKRTYYDSFDWRLYRGGITLIKDKGPSGEQISVSDLAEINPSFSLPFKRSMPCFAWDFPESSVKKKLAGLLDMRALLPLVDVLLQVTTIRLLDEERKTVLRMQLEEWHAGEVGKKPTSPIGIVLRLMPVKGYNQAYNDMQRYLADQFDLEPMDVVLFEEALSSIDRKPVDYSSKLNFKLQPESRADEVAKQIHLHLLNTLEQNIPGTKTDTDSEFLHDLRVANRRSRSALTQIKGVFSDEAIERFKSRLAWIGQITTPTRDLDVYLLGFHGYQASLPEAHQDDLEPLHRFLLAHQKMEHKTLVRRINSPHFRTLLKEWREFLEAPVSEQPSGPKGNMSVKSLADKRIYRMYKRVLEEGLAIDDASPHEMLHELRKSCKKLRYLLEFFQSLYPPKAVKKLVKALKGLLDILGDFQDFEVQAEKLREFAHQMVEEGEVPSDTLLAMGMLVDGLLKRQMQAREAFASRFEIFASEDNRENYRLLFTTKQRKPEGIK